MERNLKLSEKDLQKLEFDISNLLLMLDNKQAWRSLEEMATCKPYTLTLTEVAPVAEQKPVKGKAKVEVHEG